MNKSVKIAGYELKVDGLFSKNNKYVNLHIGGKPIKDKNIKIEKEKLLKLGKDDKLIGNKLKEKLNMEFNKNDINIPD